METLHKDLARHKNWLDLAEHLRFTFGKRTVSDARRTSQIHTQVEDPCHFIQSVIPGTKYYRQFFLWVLTILNFARHASCSWPRT